MKYSNIPNYVQSTVFEIVEYRIGENQGKTTRKKAYRVSRIVRRSEIVPQILENCWESSTIRIFIFFGTISTSFYNTKGISSL